MVGRRPGAPHDPLPGFVRLIEHTERVLRPWRWALAIGLAATALAGSVALDIAGAPAVFAPLITALVVAVAVLGTGPAALLLAVGVLATPLVVLSPRFTFGVRSGDDMLGFVAFVLTSLVILMLGAALRVARDRAEAAQSRMHRLQEVTAALARAQTPDEVAQVVLGAAAAAIGATWGLVALREEEGGTRVMRRLGPVPAGADAAAAALLQGGAGASAGDPGDLAARHPGLGVRGLVAAPFAGASVPAGMLLLALSGPRPVARDEHELVGTMAGVAAQALDRAEVFAREHDRAVLLQRSLLPQRIPRVPGVEVAVRYLAAARDAHAGGDWYDVVPLPGGDVGLCVGDVVGQGVEAAAIMGQLRSALHAYAMEGLPPAAALERLSAFAAGVPDAEVATVAYAVLEPGSGRLRYAHAGHPPMLVLHAGGPPRYLDGGRNAPLAVRDVPFDGAEDTLAAGDVLLLYSDGAVERRGEPLDDGLDRLADAAAALVAARGAGTGLDELLAGLERAVLAGGGGGDDVALLAARRTG